MSDAWSRRIDRATELAGAETAAQALLLSYREMLRLQRDCYLGVRGKPLTGSIEGDLAILGPLAAATIRAAVSIAPPALAEQARELSEGGHAAIEALLVAGWRRRAGHSFFQKLALQPYAASLFETRTPPMDRHLEPHPRTCPFCGGLPQLAVLQTAGADEGAGRQLLCATCSGTWRIGRVCCAHCGEEDERRLAYYQAAEFGHVRVDACDTCQHYLKTIDLTRLGLAEPVVDEIATGSLDLWAVEHGYRKIELNLIGL